MKFYKTERAATCWQKWEDGILILRLNHYSFNSGLPQLLSASVCAGLKFSPNLDSTFPRACKRLSSPLSCRCLYICHPVYPRCVHHKSSCVDHLFTWRGQMLTSNLGVDLHLSGYEASFSSNFWCTCFLLWTLIAKLILISFKVSHNTES